MLPEGVDGVVAETMAAEQRGWVRGGARAVGARDGGGGGWWVLERELARSAELVVVLVYAGRGGMNGGDGVLNERTGA